MEWDNIQNLLSNIVFGILLLTMIFYWVSLILFKKPYCSKHANKKGKTRDVTMTDFSIQIK